MPAAAANAEPVTMPPVDEPQHPLHALTTFELAAYRRQLVTAIAFFDTKNPVPPVRDDLQAKLDAVLAEEESRKRIREAR
jgi:hypothetical protein